MQEQGARYNSGDMTRIAITQAAFDAIVGTMPFGEARFALGNAGYEPGVTRRRYLSSHREEDPGC